MEPKSDSVMITIADTINNINSKGPGPKNLIDHQEDHQIVDHEHPMNVGATATAAAAARAGNKKKRSGGPMQILQVAVFMLRRRGRSAGNGKSKSPSLEGQAVASTKGTWKRLVGSIRPLHLQSSSPPPPSDPPTSISIERYEDVLPPPMSPAWTDDLSSEDGMTSRYASAVNLQELDRPEEDENPNSNATATRDAGREHNIDAKAEEFIAQFYQQMRLQRLDSIDRHYNDMVDRSIG